MRVYRILLSLFIICFFTNAYSQAACEFADIKVSPILTLPSCNKKDGSIVFANTTGLNPPFSYTLSDTTNRLGFFYDLGLGDYTFLVEDSRLCSATFTISLQYKEIDKIIRPDNAFTPNGDNLNDTWRIPGIDGFGGSEVLVFNRWGQQVYVNSNYSRTSSWDGTQGNSDLPAGTYYYVISIINNCLEQNLQGTVTIIR